MHAARRFTWALCLTLPVLPLVLLLWQNGEPSLQAQPATLTIWPTATASGATFTTPNNAWDSTGNYDLTAAYVVYPGTLVKCNTTCLTQNTKSATWLGFAGGYHPVKLEVHWYATATVYAGSQGDSADVQALLEYKIGNGDWQHDFDGENTDYHWVANSPACTGTIVTCYAHRSYKTFSDAESLGGSGSIQVRATFTSKMTNCYNCTNDGNSAFGTLYVHDVHLIVDNCVIPTSETTTSLGWDANSGNRTIHQFYQDLSPSGSSFSGRTVQEFDEPSGTTSDTCWFYGSSIDKATRVIDSPGASWTVGGDNSYGVDYVGNNETIVNYYQGVEPDLLPCFISGPQRMKISCQSSTPTVPYIQNTLGESIGTNYVSSQRQSNYRERSWP